MYNGKSSVFHRGENNELAYARSFVHTRLTFVEIFIVFRNAVECFICRLVSRGSLSDLVVSVYRLLLNYYPDNILSRLLPSI